MSHRGISQYINLILSCSFILCFYTNSAKDGDACEAFASEPLEELLHSFSEGQDGALVVCGPQRVRSLLGSTGSPGAAWRVAVTFFFCEKR